MRQYDNTGDGSMSLQERETRQGTVLRQDRGRKACLPGGIFMSVKLLRHHMIESIKLLASDGEVQLSCYPDFVCKGDEIANSLGDWLLLFQE